MLPRTAETQAEPNYGEFEDLISDIRPRSQALAPGEHPLRVPHVRRYQWMVFNLPTYSRLLLEDFMRFGGVIVQRDFASPPDPATRGALRPVLPSP